MRLAGCLPDAMWLNTLTSCIKVSNICMDKASLLMPDCNFIFAFETLLVNIINTKPTVLGQVIIELC